MNKILFSSLLFLSHSVFGEGVKANITSKEELYDFFDKKFHEQVWPQEIERNFEIYLSSAAKDYKKDGFFAHKIDINGIPAILVINIDSFTAKGMDYKDLLFALYENNAFNVFFGIKKRSDNGKDTYMLFLNGQPDGNGSSNKRYLSDFPVVDKKFAFREIIKEENEEYYLDWVYSNKIKRFYPLDYATFLKRAHDWALWFDYNYPDNSGKWPEGAVKSLDKIMEGEKWDYIHKGGILKSTNPTTFMMDYSTVTRNGGEVLVLTELKIIKYDGNKWNEKLGIKNGDIYTDSVLNREYAPAYDEKGYYDVSFSLNGDNGSLVIDFTGCVPGEVNQNLRYNPGDDSYSGTDMTNVY